VNGLSMVTKSVPVQFAGSLQSSVSIYNFEGIQLGPLPHQTLLNNKQHYTITTLAVEQETPSVGELVTGQDVIKWSYQLVASPVVITLTDNNNRLCVLVV